MTSKDIVVLHAKYWKETYGEDLVISWAKSCGQAARLLKTQPAEKLSNYLRFYFSEYKSSFASRSGYSFGAFIMELPGIIAAYSERMDKKSADVRHDDYERLQKAKGAM